MLLTPRLGVCSGRVPHPHRAGYHRFHPLPDCDLMLQLGYDVFVVSISRHDAVAIALVGSVAPVSLCVNLT